MNDKKIPGFPGWKEIWLTIQKVMEPLKKLFRTNRDWILACVLIVTGLCTLLGAWYFYCFLFPGHVLKCFAMAMQNLAETFLFNPILSIDAMAAAPGFMEKLPLWGRLLIFLFDVSVVVIPFLNLIIVYHIVNRFFHVILGNPFDKKRHLLIVGYNEQIMYLLKNGNDQFKVFLWTEKELSNEQRIELTQLKVHANTNESPLGTRVNSDMQQKKFNQFLKKKKINDVLLMQESDTVNIEYYMVLSSCDVCREQNIHFFVNINEFASKLTLQEFFDEQLTAEMKKQEANTSYTPFKMDLRIFNLPLIQAETIYHKLPLFIGAKKEKDYAVHLMIAGDDALAYELALLAMNQGVISKVNPITIDIYCKDIQSMRIRLNERFNAQYVVRNETEDIYSIDQKRADGLMQIRLFSADQNREEFAEKVQENTKANPYTYFICCFDDPDENLYCFRKFKSILGTIPTVLRIPYTRNMKAYLSRQVAQNPSDFNHWKISRKKWNDGDNIYLMGSKSEYLHLNDVVDLKEEEMVREFNFKYLDIMGKDTDDRDIDWNKQLYYKRQSNRFLYNHLDNKLFIVANDIEFNFEEAVNSYWGKEAKGSTKKGTYAERCSKQEDMSHKLLGSELLEFSVTEHRRFCYAYASEGWGYTDGTKDEPNLLHDCLCNWDTLKTRTDTRNKLVYDAMASREISSQLPNNNQEGIGQTASA